jgi:acyl carrier protein
MKLATQDPSLKPSRHDIETFVVAALARACNCDPEDVKGETGLLDIGVDSLSLTGVYAQCEVSYGFRLDEQQVLRVLEATRVDDIVEVVSQCVSKGA